MNTITNIQILQAALEETLTPAQRSQLQALLLLVRGEEFALWRAEIRAGAPSTKAQAGAHNETE